MFKKFRLKYAEKSLKKEMQSLNRQVYFQNFKTAKQVGIVFLQNDNFNTAFNDLLTFFNINRIKVSVMTYTPVRQIPSDFLITLNRFIFCKRDLNWYYKPTPKEVRQFIDTPFDMLIDFSAHKEFPLHYIVSLSKAHMKIGRNTYPSNPYDFVVAVSENDQDAFYIEQIKHYLEHIVIKK